MSASPADRAVAERETLATRSSLLSRLRNMGDDASWRTFFETYWRLIYNVARKNGLSDDQAQDVVQETVIAVARQIPEFRYNPAKGSFKQWLFLITRRRAADHLRRLYRARQASEEPSEEVAISAEEVPDAGPPPDAELVARWEQEWRENIFHLALARVRQQTNPKHFQVFDCCVLQNLPAPEVARVLRMSAAQVYLAKHRVTAAVKRAAVEIEAEMERGQAGKASAADLPVSSGNQALT